MDDIDIFMILFLIGTSTWVYFDAKSIGIKKGQIKGMLDMGPIGWFFITLLLWIIGFPAWLATRSKYKQINSNTEKTEKAAL
jgi:hypothetical protein